jgi:hypothetical protein
MTLEENWERAKHVVPRNFLTEKFWYKKLRACCLCGLLKTQEMWLEVRGKVCRAYYLRHISCRGCKLSISFERSNLSATCWALLCSWPAPWTPSVQSPALGRISLPFSPNWPPSK